MKRIESLKEYLDIYRQLKKQCIHPVTNMYWSLDAVSRYIDLGFMFYEMQDKGGCFFCDENDYYRLLYYVDESGQLNNLLTGKALAIRNIYKRQEERNLLSEYIDEKLKNTGFKKLYSSIEMYVPLELSEKLKKQKNVYDRMLKKGNFYISYLQEEDLDNMLKLRKKTEEFHIYNFTYKNKDEYLKEIRNKQYIGIYNEFDQLCACIYISQSTHIRTGDGICVEERYKLKYGLGAALMSYVLDDAINGYHQKYVSWCEEQNYNSMKFHKSMGFVATGKVADEWVLE